MESLEKLQEEVRKLNNKLDGISDDLVNALEKYQREYEKLLLKKNFDLEQGKLKRNIKNYNTAQSINPFRELGFNELAIDHIKKYDDIADYQLLFNKRIGIDTDFDFQDVSIIKQFKDTDLGTMYSEGQLLDSLVKKELVNAIALNTPIDTAIENLSESLLGAGEKSGRLARYATTYIRTSLNGLSRAIDKELYDKIGVNEFLYVGALDGKTRHFCKTRLGKKFTTEQIEKFGEQNGSGIDGFFSPGGFNCRHRMLPANV